MRQHFLSFIVMLALPHLTLADEKDLTVTLDDFRFSNHVLGPEVTRENFKGQVVLVEFWGINCKPCLQSMPHLTRMYNELRDFGLILVAPHAQSGTHYQIRSRATALGTTFSIYSQGNVREKNPFQFIPHTLLFDHTGKCVFRGRPTEVEARLRVALGKSLTSQLEPKTFTRAITPLVVALNQGQSPYTVLAKLLPLQKSSDKATAEQATQLVNSLTARGQQSLERVKQTWKERPIESYDELARLSVNFKGTPLGTSASQSLARLKSDKVIQVELKARPHLETIKKLDILLGGKISDDLPPTSPRFHQAYAGQLTQMKNLAIEMRKKWPDAKATLEAAGIVDHYGIDAGR